jgi:hypothetical protein
LFVRLLSHKTSTKTKLLAPAVMPTGFMNAAMYQKECKNTTSVRFSYVREVSSMDKDGMGSLDYWPSPFCDKTFCPYTGDIFALKNEMTAYIFKNYLQDFRILLSSFQFFFFFGKPFCSLQIFHGMVS